MNIAIKHIIKSNPTYTLILFLLLILQGVSPAINLYLSKLLVDALIGSVSNTLSVHLLLILWVGSLLGIQLLQPLVNLVQGDVCELATRHININILDAVNKSHSIEQFDHEERYNNLELLRQQASYRPLNFIVTLVTLLRSSITGISIAFVLYQSAGAIAILMAISILPLLAINMKVEEKNWKTLVSGSKESIIMKYIYQLSTDKQNLQEIRLFGLNRYLKGKYLKGSIGLFQRMHRQRKVALFYPLPAILFTAAVLLYGIYHFKSLADEGVLTASMLVVLLQSLIVFKGILEDIAIYGANIIGVSKFFKQYDDFVNENAYDLSNGELLLEKKEAYGLHLEKVDFTYYGSDKPSLKSVSLNIAPGAKVAIVGENGCGKSTLIKLLLRMYEPTQGKIIFDGIEIENYNVKRLREQISTVFQDFGQYQTTPFENITFQPYSKDHKELEQVEALLAKMQLTLAADTQLGKPFSGIDLSGGMWQKLAVARALYRSSGVTIFDEFSASLDPLIERNLFDLLLTLPSTVIAVTHRLNGINKFDQIIVMQSGEVVETGTFDSLMSKESVFNRMWNAQQHQ